MNIQNIFPALCLCFVSTGCLFSASEHNNARVNNANNSGTTNNGTTNNGTTNNGTTNNGTTNNGTTNNGTTNNHTTTGSNNSIAICGDGEREGEEECDDAVNTPAQRCGENYIGTQTCGIDCKFDRSNCTPIYQQISAGGSHTCGLHPDGSVRCWGDDTNDQLTPPAGIQFDEISAGTLHTCGLTSEKDIHCWGGRADGGKAPVPEGEYKSVSAGREFTCAVTANNTATCWGKMPSPAIDFVNFSGVKFVSAGQLHACVEHNEGYQCSGDGPGKFLMQENFEEFSAGNSYNCWLSAGEFLIACGDDRSQNNKPPVVSSFPTNGIKFSAIDTGLEFACAILKNAEEVKCWGEPDRLQPPPVVKMTQVSVGDEHACSLDYDGKAYCWGNPSNPLGQRVVPTD